MKPYNPKKFVSGMCKIAHNLTLKVFLLYCYVFSVLEDRVHLVSRCVSVWYEVCTLWVLALVKQIIV